MVFQDKEPESNCVVNKSHSAGYSVISVRTAWLKHYYPATFWAATLNSVLGKADKQKKYISSAEGDSVVVFPPSVNMSGHNFVEENGGIRMGLQALRNLGKSAMPLLDERDAHGKYISIADIIDRVSPDKSAIESLAYSGALDEFGFSRNAIISNIATILDYKNRIKKYDSWCDTHEIDEWYDSFLKLDIQNCPEMAKKVKLENEYHYAGMYVSEHPLDEYAEVLKLFSHTNIEELVADNDDDGGEQYAFNDERKVAVVGILKDVEKRLTKKGDAMMTAMLEDKTGSIKITAFPKQYANCQYTCIENELVVIEGTWRNDDFGSQIIVDKATPIKDICTDEDGYLFVLVNQDDVPEIAKEIVTQFGGAGPKLVIRSIMENGRATCVADKNGENVSPCAFKDVQKNNSCARVKLSFTNFLLIKEMVKDIAVMKVSK